GHNQFGQRGSETGAGAIDVLPSPYSKYRANDVAMDQVSRLLCGGKPRRRREKTEYGQPFSKPFFARGKQPEWSKGERRNTDPTSAVYEIRGVISEVKRKQQEIQRTPAHALAFFRDAH